MQSQTEMVKLLNPSTDFYKRLALECSGQQIAVDLFVIARWVNKHSEATARKIWQKCPIILGKFQFNNENLLFSQHCDLATLSGISKFSGGQVSWTNHLFFTTGFQTISKYFDPGANFPWIPQPSQPPSSREIWTSAQKISYKKGQQSHNKHSISMKIILFPLRLDLRLWWEYVALGECRFTLSTVNIAKYLLQNKYREYVLPFSIRIFPTKYIQW